MNTSVIKFINYLENFLIDLNRSINRLEKNVVNINTQTIDCTSSKKIENEKAYQNLIHTKKFVKIALAILKNTGKGNLIECFGFFSTLLITSNLSEKVKMDVVMYLVKRNIDLGILTSENSPVLNILSIRKYFPYNIEEEKFIEYLNTLDYATLLESKDENLSKEERSLRKMIQENMEKDFEIRKNRITFHRLIKEHYFDKVENYTKNDISFIIKSLKYLDIDPRLCASIEYILSKNIQKRETKSSKPCNSNIKSKKIVELPLTRKEYKQIYHEISNLYDIENQRAIRPLNIEELIYLVSLLNKINIPEKEIIKCIQISYKEFDSGYKNPICEFNAYYEKMLYYSDNEDISAAISYIKGCIEMLFIPESKKSYEIWKNEIKNTIHDILPVLNQHYEYELEVGRTLSQN